MRAGFTRRSPTPTPASTSSCAAPTRSAPATTPSATPSTPPSSTRSPPCPACAPPSPSIEGIATILGADGEPHRRRRSADDRHQLDRRPRPQPLPPRRGPRPPGPRRGRHRPRRGRATATSTSATRTTVLTPKPVEVTVVGIATFGDVDSLGPTTYTAFTLPQASELFAQRPDTDLVRARGRRGRRQPGDAARRDHRSRCRPASRR